MATTRLMFTPARRPVLVARAFLLPCRPCRAEPSAASGADRLTLDFFVFPLLSLSPSDKKRGSKLPIRDLPWRADTSQSVAFCVWSWQRAMATIKAGAKSVVRSFTFGWNPRLFDSLQPSSPARRSPVVLGAVTPEQLKLSVEAGKQFIPS